MLLFQTTVINFERQPVIGSRVMMQKVRFLHIDSHIDIIFPLIDGNYIQAGSTVWTMIS